MHIIICISLYVSIIFHSHNMFFSRKMYMNYFQSLSSAGAVLESTDRLHRGVLEKMDMTKALALLRSGFLDQDDILEATSWCQIRP